MKKPAQLRRVLEAHVPAIKADPVKLSLFIDKGEIRARPGSLGFEYSYTLNAVVQDYAGDVDALIVPVLAWIAGAQPDLLERAPQRPFTFGTEILAGDLADVSIYIELTEAVRVIPLEDGGFSAEHLAEPGANDRFEDVPVAPLWQAVLNGGIVAQTFDPAFDPDA